MSRCSILILLVAALFSPPMFGQSETVSASATTGRVATLQQQLEKGLRVRQPSEFEYVGRVAELVQQRRLPLKLVQGSFDYARRRGHRHYPFQYFRRVLELRAARIGVNLSPTAVVQ
ncbi:MAG: hypothetical protein KDB27_11440 [Planctomycetales bacterium]|nr:hypothetical protein [Planctomycetales bacterium]